MPPQLEKHHVVPTAWQDEALARDGVSREVPGSVLKCEMVPDSFHATPKSPPQCQLHAGLPGAEARRKGQGSSPAPCTWGFWPLLDAARPPPYSAGRISRIPGLWEGCSCGSNKTPPAGSEGCSACSGPRVWSRDPRAAKGCAHPLPAPDTPAHGEASCCGVALPCSPSPCPHGRERCLMTSHDPAHAVLMSWGDLTLSPLRSVSDSLQRMHPGFRGSIWTEGFAEKKLKL